MNPAPHPTEADSSRYDGTSGMMTAWRGSAVAGVLGRPDCPLLDLPMSTLVHVLFALVLLAIAAFCVFGFMATFEPPADANKPLRVIYGLVGVGCLAGAAWLATPRRPKA